MERGHVVEREESGVHRIVTQVERFRKRLERKGASIVPPAQS